MVRCAANTQSTLLSDGGRVYNSMGHDSAGHWRGAHERSPSTDVRGQQGSGGEGICAAGLIGPGLCVLIGLLFAGSIAGFVLRNELLCREAVKR